MSENFKKMVTDFKKQSEKRKVLSLGGVAAVILALAVYLVFEFAIGEEVLTFWPVWSFFITLFCSTGLFYIIYGLIRKINAVLIIGFAAIILGTFFLLISLSVPWAVVIVVTAVFVIMLYGLTFIIKSPSASTNSEYTEEPVEEKVDEDIND